MLVLVTGAAGFIGSHVVEALAEAGHEVRGVDALLPSAHDGAAEPPAGVMRGDLRDRDVARVAVAGVDAVVHHAAMVGLGADIRDIDAYVSHNDLGTAVLLRALAERSFAGRIVLASSMVVYGEGGYACPEHGDVRPGPRRIDDLAAGRFDPPCPECGAGLAPVPVSEDSPVDPRSTYAATKLHQEHLVACYARECDGVDATALRYHNVYGPRMPRDTPYAGVAVEDVACASVLALEGPPGTYNVGTGRPRCLLDMARALAAAHPGGGTPRVTGEFRRGDVRHVFAATERAASALGFRARTTLEDGMREFAAASLR